MKPSFLFAIAPLWISPLTVSAQAPTAEDLGIEPQDILSTEVRHDGRRRITFQELDPAAMAVKEQQLQPPPTAPIPQEPPSGMDEPPAGKPIRQLGLGASVHIADPALPENAVTFLKIQPAGGGAPISLWINANFLWLTGAPSEIETAHARHSLMLLASAGGGGVPENLPFPQDGKASLIIAEGDPTAEQLEPIDALLALYDRDKALLRERYEQKVREAAEKEAARLADPPEKKNIIIRYWQGGGTNSESPMEGGRR